MARADHATPRRAPRARRPPRPHRPGAPVPSASAQDEPTRPAHAALADAVELLAGRDWTAASCASASVPRTSPARPSSELSIGVTLYGRLISRTAFEQSLATDPALLLEAETLAREGVLEAGARRATSTSRFPLDSPGISTTNSGVYPLKVELRSGFTSLGVAPHRRDLPRPAARAARWRSRGRSCSTIRSPSTPRACSALAALEAALAPEGASPRSSERSRASPSTTGSARPSTSRCRPCSSRSSSVCGTDTASPARARWSTSPPTPRRPKRRRRPSRSSVASRDRATCG